MALPHDRVLPVCHVSPHSGILTCFYLEAPEELELSLAIDVMEDLLNFLYEMEYELTRKAKMLASLREQQIADFIARRSRKKG